MTEKELLQVYKYIKSTLNNKFTKAYSIAQELYRAHGLEKEDLIQDIMCVFLTRNHKEIMHLKGYVTKFCYNELMNIKRKHSSSKHLKRYYFVNLDDYEREFTL